MVHSDPKVHNDPKEALSAYIQELEGKYYNWYDCATKRDYMFWSIAQGIAIVAGLTTVVLATASHQGAFEHDSRLGLCLILAPVIGTLASTLLLQTGIRDLFDLRERGRQAIQLLATLARAEFAAADSSIRYTQIHRDLAERVRKVEEEQTIGFFSIAPDLGQKKQPKNGGDSHAGAKGDKPNE
jgi:hypothetical protein